MNLQNQVYLISLNISLNLSSNFFFLFDINPVIGINKSDLSVLGIYKNIIINFS